MFRICPRPRSSIARQKEAGQRRQRCDVNADHALLLCQIGFGKRAVVAKPGIIDQAIHVHAKRANPIKHPLRCSWFAEVLGYSVCGDASPQFVSGGLKRALVATNQNRLCSSAAACRASSSPMPLLAPVISVKTDDWLRICVILR